MILNNIFHFRLCKTVSVATTTPLKHIPVFDIQSSFDIQALSRRKHDQKNQQYFKTWKEWTTAHQVCFLPAEPMHMALYLLSKVQASHTFPTIDASFYAIKFFHKSLLNVNPWKRLYLWTIWTNFLLSWIKTKLYVALWDLVKYQDFVVQSLFLVAPTSRSSSRKVREKFIGKECGFTYQLLAKFVH